MYRALGNHVAAVPLLAALAVAQEPAEPRIAESEVQTVEDLVRYVRQRERDVERLEMAIVSTGRFPDGSSFRTEGTLRVLGKTHFHARMKGSFGEGMEVETETVRSPDGIRMRERDPVAGEVFLRMDRETMARVDSAIEFLGGDAAASGFNPAQTQTESPLGAAILEDLARQFDLAVRPPRVVDGARCWAVSGPRKQGSTPEQDPFGLGADQVDCLVRVGDGAVVRMAQLEGGEPLLEVRIEQLKLDPPLAEESFTLPVPDNAKVVDALDHPPAADQLERLFADAREKGWVDPQGGGTEPAERKDR